MVASLMNSRAATSRLEAVGDVLQHLDLPAARPFHDRLVPRRAGDWPDPDARAALLDRLGGAG
jgi:hypothetical protein